MPFHPYYTMKDALRHRAVPDVFAWFVFFVPNFSATPDNYIPANPLKTPPHIVPEWYFLPFYAILRSIPNKLVGVIAMFGAIAVLAFLPWLDTSKVRSAKYRPIYKIFFWLFVVCGVGLGYLGAMPPGGRLCAGGAHPDGGLFRLLPGRPADARAARADHAGAGDDSRCGARQERVRFIGRGGRRLRSADQGLIGRFRGNRKMALTKKLGFAAAAVFGAVAFSTIALRAAAEGGHAEQPNPDRQSWSFSGLFGTFDQGPIAARLQDLQGSLLELSWAEHSVPHAQPAWRAVLHGRSGQGPRRDLYGP